MTNLDVQTFAEEFIKGCKEKNIDNFSTFLQQIKAAYSISSGGYKLDFSNCSIPNNICSILGGLFKTNVCFSEIHFNDCFLTNDGVRALSYGFAENIGCQTLYLKGNSIRGSAVEAIGRMIRLNTKLKSLCLEWNTFGLVGSSFEIFCEGLSGNTTLINLDLRSNQLNHLDAITLANALQINKTLRCLDLRWNNIGLLGGRALLKMLETNKTIVKLLTTGNNIPNDTAKYIDIMVARNGGDSKLDVKHKHEEINVREFKCSCNKKKVIHICECENNFKTIKRNPVEKIYLLMNALDERKEEYITASVKLSQTESELAIVESKLIDLTQEMNASKSEFTNATKNLNAEIYRVKEDKLKMESQLNIEITTLTENNYRLQNKIDELEQKDRSQRENIFDLKEKNIKITSELKMKQSQFEEKMESEKKKYNDEIYELQMSNNKEVTRLQAEYLQCESQYKDKLRKSEMVREDLENNALNAKKQAFNEKLLFDDQVKAMKTALRAEEEQLRYILEERIKISESNNSSLNAQIKQLLGQVNDLQKHNTTLSAEKESLSRRVDDLEKALAVNANKMEMKLRQAKKESILRVEEEINSKKLLLQQIKLEKNREEARVEQSNLVASLESELKMLKQILQKINDTDVVGGISLPKTLVT